LSKLNDLNKSVMEKLVSGPHADVIGEAGSMPETANPEADTRRNELRAGQLLSNDRSQSSDLNQQAIDSSTHGQLEDIKNQLDLQIKNTTAQLSTIHSQIQSKHTQMASLEQMVQQGGKAVTEGVSASFQSLQAKEQAIQGSAGTAGSVAGSSQQTAMQQMSSTQQLISAVIGSLSQSVRVS